MPRPDFRNILKNHSVDINAVYEWQSKYGRWSKKSEKHEYTRCRRLIHYVAKHSNLCIFEYLVHHNATLSVTDDPFRQHPIHFAAQNMDTGILWKMLDQDQTLSSLEDGNGNLAITYAINKDNVGAVMVLQEFGQELTPEMMDYAAAHGSPNVYKYLHLQKVGPATIEHLCLACFCNVRLTKYLVRFVDVNARNSSGTTPLIEAASSECNSDDLITILLCAGADSLLTNTNGAYPLHWYLWNFNREGSSHESILRQLMHPSIDLTQDVVMSGQTSMSALDLCDDSGLREILEN